MNVSDDRLAEWKALALGLRDHFGLRYAKRAADALDEAAAEVERLRAAHQLANDAAQVYLDRAVAAEARLDAVRALCATTDPADPIRSDLLWPERVRAALGDTPGEAQ